MALGGGTFTVQNKVLPGTYINFVSEAGSNGTLGERGVVCMAMAMDWGQEGMIEIQLDEFLNGMENVLGYELSSEKLTSLREVFTGAKTVKLYRLNSGEKACLSVGDLTVIAKYGGVRGNDLKIAISDNVDDDSKFDVKTYLESTVIDTQIVSSFDELVDNDYVSFSGSGEITPVAPVSLTCGTSTTGTGADYSGFLSAAEAEDFNVLIYDGDDAVTKKLFTTFTKRMRDDEGIKFVLVLKDYTEADFEGVISLGNAHELIYWTAGMTAGAEVNESLTNVKYDGELSVDAKLSKTEYSDGIESGKFLFYSDGSDVRVLRDINSFTDFSNGKNSDFSSNRLIRVLDGIGNDIARIFSDYYLGKQGNDVNGRNLLKAEIIAYHEQLQNIGAIEGFSADDITVSLGTNKQDVIISESVQPTDAMEKLYMQVEVV